MTMPDDPRETRDGGGEIALAVQERVDAILREAEERAAARAAAIEDDAARRAAEVVADAEEEAARLRASATAEAEAYLAASRDRVDDFARARVELLEKIAAAITEHSAALDERLSRAISVKDQLDELVTALGAAATAAAAEGAAPAVDIPRLGPALDAFDEEPETVERQDLLNVPPALRGLVAEPLAPEKDAEEEE